MSNTDVKVANDLADTILYQDEEIRRLKRQVDNFAQESIGWRKMAEDKTTGQVVTRRRWMRQALRVMIQAIDAVPLGYICTYYGYVEDRERARITRLSMLLRDAVKEAGKVLALLEEIEVERRQP